MKQEPIKPTVPLAPWLGGKSKIAKQLVKRFSSIEHKTYVEPFIGMGGVFLRKPFKSKVEVINDLNKDISNLFRVVKKHPDALIKELEFQLTSVDDFYRLRDIPADYLTDIEKAARFLFLQKLSYGGQVVSRGFARRTHRRARFNIYSLQPLIHDLHKRLSTVIIDNLPYQQVIERYDTNKTLFYLDTPYYQREDYYGKDMFSSEDYHHLAKQLATLKGRFFFSINDHKDIREIFKSFNIETMDIVYSLQAGNQETVTELLITNIP